MSRIIERMECIENITEQPIVRDDALRKMLKHTQHYVDDRKNQRE